MDSVGLDPEPLGSDPDIKNGQCGSEPNGQQQWTVWVQAQTSIMGGVGLSNMHIT